MAKDIVLAVQGKAIRHGLVVTGIQINGDHIYDKVQDAGQTNPSGVVQGQTELNDPTMDLIDNKYDARFDDTTYYS